MSKRTTKFNQKDFDKNIFEQLDTLKQVFYSETGNIIFYNCFDYFLFYKGNNGLETDENLKDSFIKYHKNKLTNNQNLINFSEIDSEYSNFEWISNVIDLDYANYFTVFNLKGVALFKQFTYLIYNEIVNFLKEKTKLPLKTVYILETSSEYEFSHLKIKVYTIKKSLLKDEIANLKDELSSENEGLCIYQNYINVNLLNLDLEFKQII